MNICIIDYNVGNIGSIVNMLKRIGYLAEVTNDVNKIRDAQKIILPGVGAFDIGIKKLREFNLVDDIIECVLVKKIPILGICLGMQLMANRSEEGIEKGLSLIDAEVKKFNFNDNLALKIPHMGWNSVEVRKSHPLIKDMKQEIRFYFVHSYYVKCNREEDILTTTKYGISFVSAFAKGNIMGVQFHPEKSHKFGMHLLKNFIENF
ncbi:MAG: imidazole glycerol phosphate synthase subunit HisH [Candidatus Woesearchaeota archaeon]